MDVYVKKENTPERFKANVKITTLFKIWRTFLLV